MIFLEYLKEHQTKGTHLKVFLTSGAMLEGKIKGADESGIILNECLIMRDKIVSISPPVKGPIKR